MIIVLPVCSKDHAAAIRNLAWARELDTSAPFPCLISCESGYNANEVIQAARIYFSSVQVFNYPPFGSSRDSRWPRPQNYAWRQVALHICKAYRDPWFWWEQDAVPLKPGWLPTLESAYRTAGKPFMGAIGAKAVPTQADHMNGVAIYPANWNAYCPESMLFSDALAFDVCGGWRVLKHAEITPFIQHLWSFENNAGGPACTFPNREWLIHVSKCAVLFHRCKDGSLIDQVREHPIHERKPRSLIPKRRMRRRDDFGIESHDTSEVTVVITNFQRPDMLWRAYQSCVRAKVAHIVVTSSAVTEPVQTILDRIAYQNPKTQITSLKEDDGCNNAWLRGARLVKTRMATILHDDDFLTPCYEDVVAGKFDSDFIHWDGAKHRTATRIPGSYITRPDLPEGEHPATFLLAHLLRQMTWTLSPVSGCFPSEHIVETLEECNAKFGPWAYLRPTMMVGNDSLLWMRACQKYRTMYYSHSNMVSYGHWEGSTSFDDVSKHKNKLWPIYRDARGYFVGTLPKMIHAVPRYHPSSAETDQRIKTAEATWELAYNLKCVVPDHQWDYKRDSSLVGEPKKTPFLKDILEHALSIASDNDMIVFTNDDTLTNIFFWMKAMDWLKEYGAGCSFRRCISKETRFIADKFGRALLGEVSPGRDAFFFTREWLQSHLAEIPDYLIGFGDWDSTLAMLIRLSHGDKPKPDEFVRERNFSEIPSGMIYHVNHDAAWTLDKNAAGMRHNRSLTDEFFMKRLGWPMPKMRGDW